ncbi:TetR/AcrR family transcriptional regulator [Sediminitomix flava]|uniref:TetR family transcriptional regulator n=1 Tax=Sediminitomix flava TaxID=379075 RepID=A0A315ZFL9_SEDFL|nr:TetR/AcrR family transcriptional regulator [Sediminitomix flava]PWJ44301.1 TetR family transcriptional regulator [Sediminitomix flava]
MAKSIDESKIERIKEATIEMVVDKGYGGASVSAIAKKAGVADGYLYRHYPSKQALVQDLYISYIKDFKSNILEQSENNDDFEDVLFAIIMNIFRLANEAPSRAKFLNMLMNDYTFLMSEDFLRSIPESLEKLCEVGKAKGCVSEDITTEEFVAVFPAIPIELASLRVKGIFSSEPLSEKDAKRAAKLCIKALK